MFKLLVLASLFAVSCGMPIESADETKSKLIEAGVSESTASGIVAINDKYRDQLESFEKAQVAAKNLFDTSIGEINAYIASQSEADQNAFKTYIGQLFADAFAGKGSQHPSAEETKSKLTAAGVSEDVASGVVAIQEKYRGQFDASEKELEAGKQAFQSCMAEIEAYVKSQPEEDQKAIRDSIGKAILKAFTNQAA